MPRVRQQSRQHRQPAAVQQPIPLDDGTRTTLVMLALIQALIPLGLRAVEAALQTEVLTLAGPQYARGDAHPELVRWGAQPGSIYLADQQLPIVVPRVRVRMRCRRTPKFGSARLLVMRRRVVLGDRNLRDTHQDDMPPCAFSHRADPTLFHGAVVVADAELTLALVQIEPYRINGGWPPGVCLVA